MADTPTWSLIIDASTKLVTTTALLIGAGIGYLRYLRGRLFHAKVDLDVSADITQVIATEALSFTISVRNAGTCRLNFPTHTEQVVEICAVLRDEWTAAITDFREPHWQQLCFFRDNVLKPGSETDTADRELEPGQGWVRSLLVPVPTNPDPVAYRIRLIVEACPRYVFRVKPALEPRSTETVLVKG